MKKLWVCVSLFFILSQLGMAQEYMIIGGGYGPFDSQASLEKNVADILKLIQNKNKDVFFGSGSNQTICDVTEKVREADQILLDILSFEDYQKTLYECKIRHHQLHDVNYPAEKDAILKVLQQKKSPQNTQALKIYYTGHGNHESSYLDDALDEIKNSGLQARLAYNNNYLALWNTPNLSVQEFTAHLDQMNPRKPIQIIMTQCYSGGFSQINYEGGNVSNFKLSNHNRCGFFSQTPYDTAAGCTNDLEKNQEYTHYFLEALRTPSIADYNKDSVVSALEAHSYVTINSETIDVPITTSEQLLDDYMTINEKKFPKKIKNLPMTDLFTRLNPLEKSTFLGLLKRLALSEENFGTATYNNVRNKIYDLQEELAELRDEISISSFSNYIDAVKQLRRIAQGQFPYAFLRSLPNQSEQRELQEQFNEDMIQLENYLKSNDDQVTHLSTLYQAYAHDVIHYETLERKIAVWKRLIHLLQIAIMREEVIKDKNILEKYQNLIACEQAPFF